MSATNLYLPTSFRNAVRIFSSRKLQLFNSPLKLKSMVSYSNKIEDSSGSFFSKACCELPPLTSDYKPKGSILNRSNIINNNIKYYLNEADSDSKATVIGIYDIFGFHNSTFQFMDYIGKGLNCRIVMPDFFEGNCWSTQNYPPKDPKQFKTWINSVGNWEVIKPKLDPIIDHYHNLGSKISIVGFCWGGKIGLEICKTYNAKVQGCAIVHPSMFDYNDAKKINIPLLVIATKDEPDMKQFMQNIPNDNYIREKSKLYEFMDMYHGFCAARANYNDPQVALRAAEANDIVQGFLRQKLA